MKTYLISVAGICKSFLEDPEIQPVFAIRHKSTIRKLILVEGGSWRDGIR